MGGAVVSLKRYYARRCDYCTKEANSLAASSSQSMTIARASGIKRYVTRVRSWEQVRYGEREESRTMYVGYRADVCSVCQITHPELKVPTATAWAPRAKAQEEVSP